MRKEDEPVFGEDVGNEQRRHDEWEPGVETIARLVDSVPFGVLCTQGQGQPYGSVVAFAFSEDLATAVFATPQATRKYRLLSECKRVSLVIDNRPEFPDDMMRVEAVTVTGTAVDLERGAEFDRCADMLVARHPYLKSFVVSESCALFRIEPARFFHVRRFQEVRQWIPPRR
jgi:nitroimidazol reductase NimA-like FMN-containing flavoprotein (pyridoxamine 5'-phosphate oxidase superfamily)